MEVNEIRDIQRVPLAIDYRRMYRANARIAIGQETVSSCPIEFVLELSPLGSHEVSVSFLDTTDFPIVPAIKILKEQIVLLDREGTLP